MDRAVIFFLCPQSPIRPPLSMSGGRGGHRGGGGHPPGMMHWGGAYGPPLMGGGGGALPPPPPVPPPFHPFYPPPPPVSTHDGGGGHPGGYIQLPPDISLSQPPPQGAPVNAVKPINDRRRAPPNQQHLHRQSPVKVKDSEVVITMANYRRHFDSTTLDYVSEDLRYCLSLLLTYASTYYDTMTISDVTNTRLY